MAKAVPELTQLKQLLQKLNRKRPMKLICDKQANVHIVFNSVFHDFNLVREKKSFQKIILLALVTPII